MEGKRDAVGGGIGVYGKKALIDQRLS